MDNEKAGPKLDLDISFFANFLPKTKKKKKGFVS